uniref:uncharacterized protein LOC100186430 isoform X2 n=1 Tax=Ciona intestinalis TaxID=7719 RepID=UPI000EF4AE2A|nr:uncharacterized protein LOC100186430 isoform X2 [Ciona intestinalis]|eukprot:XP_026690165.1 uncharacterized protein LOC100186430 isoform X2 [Ciona intestinalis]
MCEMNSVSMDSIQLGCSASVYGGESHIGTNYDIPKRSSVDSIFESSQSSIASQLSSLSTKNHQQRRIIVENWKIVPVLGLSEVRIVGVRCSDKQVKKSSFIKLRMHSRCLLTNSGSLYNLVGPMQKSPDIPDNVYKAMINGFPENWRSVVRSYLHQLNQNQSDESSSENEVVHIANNSLNITPRVRVVMETPLSKKRQPDFLVTPTPCKKPRSIAVKKTQDLIMPLSSVPQDILETPANKKKKQTRKRQAAQRKPAKRCKLNKSVLPSCHADLCSESPSGLFRTRSGRHVFPPLQSWTGQRLSTECNEDGVEVVKFHPGNESILAPDVHSPVTDALRKTDIIHRQFIFNQMCDKKDSLPQQKTGNHCVKKILDTPVAKKKPVQKIKNISPLNTVEKIRKIRQKKCKILVSPLKLSENEQVLTKPGYSLRIQQKSMNNPVTKESLKLPSENEELLKKKPLKLQHKNSEPSNEVVGTRKSKRAKNSKVEKKCSPKKRKARTVKPKKNNVAVCKKKKEPGTKKEKSKNQDVALKNTGSKIETLKITAQRGTLKHRKQVQAVANELNFNQKGQDFFADEAVVNEMFGESNGFLDQSLGTPAKNFLYIPENVKTPLWFKTPQAQKYSSVFPDTPDHLKSSLPRPAEYPDADRMVLCMKKALKHGKGNETKKPKPSKNFNLDKVNLKELLRGEQQEDVDSSEEEDVYFSD